MLLVRTRPLLTRNLVTPCGAVRYTILVTEAIRAWETLLPWETADLLRQQLDLGDVSVDETDNEHLKIRNTV